MKEKNEKIEKDEFEEDTEEKKAENSIEFDSEILKNLEKKCLELTEENSVLKEKLKQEEELNLRIRAEFNNFKNRTSKEKLNLKSSVVADCVLPMLSVLDNFERAMESINDSKDADLIAGISLIETQFKDVFKKLGVEEIESDGVEFNPNCHNAVNTIKDENLGSNVVSSVLQKGYRINENVIRHATVIVANPWFWII